MASDYWEDVNEYHELSSRALALFDRFQRFIPPIAVRECLKVNTHSEGDFYNWRIYRYAPVDLGDERPIDRFAIPALSVIPSSLVSNGESLAVSPHKSYDDEGSQIVKAKRVGHLFFRGIKLDHVGNFGFVLADPLKDGMVATTKVEGPDGSGLSMNDAIGIYGLDNMRKSLQNDHNGDMYVNDRRLSEVNALERLMLEAEQAVEVSA